MFNKFAIKATQLTGSPIGFTVALLLVIGWVAIAKDISYNDFITMLSFMMLFVIQYSQNKDTAALHLKIDELIKSSNARNELAGIEELSVNEIKAMKEKPIPPVDRRSSEGVLPDEIKAMKETNY